MLNYVVSSHSSRGGRGIQEDSARIITGFDPWLTLAVTDGFSKRDNAGTRIGERTADRIAGCATFHIDMGANETDGVFHLAENIHDAVGEELSGATYAFAAADLSAGSVIMAALGDCVAAVRDDSGSMHMCPFANLGMGGGRLWGCVGDRENRLFHSFVPELGAAKIGSGSVAFVATDGAFPETSDMAKTPHENALAIRRLVESYFSMIAGGATAEDIVGRALSAGQGDNVTVAFAVFS